MASNDEILAKLPGAIEKLAQSNAAIAEKARVKTEDEGDKLRKALAKASLGAEFDQALSKFDDFEKNQARQAEIAEQNAKSTAGQAIALKAELVSQGKVAEDNKEFQKLSYQARKEDYEQRIEDATSPAQKKELRQEARADAKKNGSRLEKIGAGIRGLFEIGKKGLKTAALGAGGLLSTLAIGGLLIALSKFLQSDTFKDMTKFIQEEILPYLTEIGIAIASIIGAVAIARFVAIANKVRLAFLAVKTFMLTTMLDGVKSMIGGVVGAFTKAATKVKNAFIAVKTFMLTTMLDGVKSMIGGVVGAFTKAALLIKNAFIAVQVFALETMLPAVKGMIGGALAQFASIAKRIKLAFLAVQTFMLATMLPAIVAFMVPLLPVIAVAAAVALVLYALWEAFQDFRKTLDETGSIGEAIKVAIGKFIGVLMGAIPALFLKLVAFVADLFGFKEFAKKIGDIDPIQFIADTAVKFMDKIGKFFGSIFDIDFSSLLDQIVPAFVKKSWLGRQLGFSGGETVTPEAAKAERLAKLEKERVLIGGPRDSMGRHKAAERGAAMDVEIDKLKSEAAAGLAKPTVLPKAKMSEAETLESQRLSPSQFKESGSIQQKMAQSKTMQEAMGARYPSSAGQTNIVDARQSSNVTTTGQSGNSSLTHNKFVNLNLAGSGLDM